jgi:hypothetical protein
MEAPKYLKRLAPQVGLEPTTLRLTAESLTRTGVPGGKPCKRVFLLCLEAAPGHKRTRALREYACFYAWASWKLPRTVAFDRVKTVSKRDPFERWDLLLSEEQTPHIVEKPKNRTYPMEPREASRGLHTQEVHGSSPCAPTIQNKKVIRISCSVLSLRLRCDKRSKHFRIWTRAREAQDFLPARAF